jgi:hypothetical protein
MFSAAIKTSSTTGYQISRSLRFNSADSAYLNRTPASAGNRRTWTWSAWVKRSELSGNAVFAAGDGSAGNRAAIDFDSDQFRVIFGDGTSLIGTTQVFRDPSAWYHFVVAVDTTQATASNRVKLYVNGSEITALSSTSYPAQNYDTFVNATNLHTLGARYRTSVDSYFNGYMTEVNFIDGQALTPSSFGQTNAQTGVWEPVAYSGSYGTNGFYLNFSDNSNTTAATLGKDYSGNGNNWTPNNFSVSAGAGNDSLVDVPTNWGSDGGFGGEVRGNYCTLNPLIQRWLVNTATFSNGNLDTANTNASNAYVFGTTSVNSGKYYWEITVTNIGSAASGFSVGVDSGLTQNSIFSDIAVYGGDGNKYVGSTSASAYGATYTTNDVIGVALDKDAGTITFYKNGSSQGSINLPTSVSVVPFISPGVTSGSATANFGQRPFAYTAPSGFKALCTQNLPTPTIGATSTTQANDYFNILLWTANGGTQTVSGLGFQPDFVWHKPYGVTADHALLNAVVGSSGRLASNTTAAEVTNANFQTAFTSDGWSMGTDNFGTGRLLVTWAWKANGAGSSNTAGSITSTVSANTTSGFSVVTWTTDGTTKTVGHGLGVAPKMIIVKQRNATSPWYVFTTVIDGSYDYLVLNATDAAANSSYTAPTSTVFEYNDDNAATQVAYCFAEVPGFSKFGSYTGNGSSDGPFIFTGFRPAFVLIKGTSAGYIWTIEDNKRDTYNPETKYLQPQASDAEGTFTTQDFVSNGFKIRTTDTAWNGNGITYIFMAFAENPFKYSLAR